MKDNSRSPENLFERRREAKPPYTRNARHFDQVRVDVAQGRGLGVFATAPVKARFAIGRVLGEIKPKDYRSDYCVEFGDGALEPFAPYRFLNHSCDPNCEFIEWTIDVPLFNNDSSSDEPSRELWLHAIRDVKEGEELTVDYGWEWRSAIPCLCGSPNCRGWICRVEDLEELRRHVSDDGSISETPVRP